MAVVQWNSINLFVLLPRMRNRHAINVNDAITLVLSVNKCNLVMFRSLTVLPCTPWLLHRSRQHVRPLHRHIFPGTVLQTPTLTLWPSTVTLWWKIEGPDCERSSWPPASPTAAFPWTQESVETSARNQILPQIKYILQRWSRVHLINIKWHDSVTAQGFRGTSP